MTTPYIDPNLIFAENAPVQDKPAAFQNYDKGWDASRNNYGRPLIPQMNYLTQQSDLKNLYIHENGAALPYKEGVAYEENAVVVKGGILQQWRGGVWVNVSAQEVKKYLIAAGVAEPELDSDYDFLMQRLAQIAVDKGWDASFVVDASGKTQQEINNNQKKINLDTPTILDLITPAIELNTNTGDITNFLANINTVVSEGTRIKIPYGDFTVSDEVTISKNNIWLDIDNAKITQTATGKALFRTDADGFRVSGGRLYGKGTEFNGATTSFNGACAILLDSCKNARIHDNNCFNFAGGGVRWIGSADGHTIQRNSFEGIGSSKINAGDNGQDFAIGVVSSSGDYNLKILDNTMSNHSFGISLYGGAGCTVTGNTVFDIVGQHGIYIHQPNGLILGFNNVRNCALDGIKVQIQEASRTCKSVAVVGNTSNDNGLSGINVSSTVSSSGFIDSVITNNTTDGNAAYGVTAHYFDGVIDGNKVFNNIAYPYYLNHVSGSVCDNVSDKSDQSAFLVIIKGDLTFSGNKMYRAVLNAESAAADTKYYYYALFQKSASAAGTPNLYYIDNLIDTRGTAPTHFMGASGNAIRVNADVKVHHVGDNINLTGKSIRVENVAAYDIGYSPNCDVSVSAVLNPTVPIYGRGRKELYGTQAPDVAAMTDTFRQGDVCWNVLTTHTTSSVLGWVCVVSGSPGVWKPMGITGATKITGLTSASTAAQIVAALQAAGLAV